MGVGEYSKVLSEAAGFLADAMNEPHESYPPIFATYVREGVPTGSSVSVDTALTAIAFALMDRDAPALAKE